MAITLTRLAPNGAPLDPPPAPEPNPAAPGVLDYVLEPRRDRSRLVRYGLIGAIVLIWIAIGATVAFWWVNQNRSGANSLDPNYQRMYLTVVAQRYWQTSDLARAQRDLIQWKDEDLAQLLWTMQGEAKNPETRKQLAVLAAALRVPEPQTPALYSLVSRETILIALLFALVPLLVALGVVAAPYVRAWTRPRAVEALPIEEESIEKLEELLPDMPVVEQETAPDEEKKEEEKKETEPLKEEEEESSQGLGDLASLFEEEDVSLSSLEAFTKGMPEVNVDDLIKNCMDSLRQLGGLNAAAAKRTLQ